MDVGADIFDGLVNVAVAIVEAVARILLLLIETGLRVVIWILSPFLSEEQRRARLPEKCRLAARRAVYALLAFGAVYALVYFVWLREPPPAPPPTKIDKALKVIEKAKQIKETLLPPKPQP